MRIQTTRAVRVGPGDKIVVRGQLPASAKLGRMYVFASAEGGEFAPYVHGVAAMPVMNGMPMMLKPVSMRLVQGQPPRTVSFVSDIDGYICVMQEVDTQDEPRAKIRIECQINPDLNWKDWLWRKMQQFRPMPKPT